MKEIGKTLRVINEKRDEAFKELMGAKNIKNNTQYAKHMKTYSMIMHDLHLLSINLTSQINAEISVLSDLNHFTSDDLIDHFEGSTTNKIAK